MNYSNASSPFRFGGGLQGLFRPVGHAAGAVSPVITPPYRPPAVRPPGPQQQFQNPSRPQPSSQPTAPTPNAYNLQTNPAFQQAEALIGLSNGQANAAAQKQIKDLLLSYGDPALVRGVLGRGGNDLAAAAAHNPTSTTAQLRQQKARNLTTLEDQLNSANLSYSGYRVKEEQQAAQDYQNQLAGAANQVQSQIGTIQSALQQAIASNNWQLAQAAQAAYEQAVSAAMQNGTNPGGLAAAAGQTSPAGGFNPRVLAGQTGGLQLWER